MPAAPGLWSLAAARLWIASFLVFLSFFLLMPVLPLYALREGVPESAIGLIIGVFALTAMVGKPLVGWLLDWRGRRGFLWTGAALFGVASALYPMAHSTAPLLLVRMLHGAGMGLFPTAGVAVAVDLAPPERRGEALGLFGMAGTLALAVGPLAGVALDRALGFPALCLSAALLAALGTVLSLWVPETGVPADPPPFRVGGLFAPAAFRPAAIALALCLTYGALASFLPLLTQARAAGNPGAFFGLMALALLVVRAYAGRLSDRYGRRAIVLPATVLTAGSLALLAWGPSASWVYGAGFVFGLGFGSAQPALLAWAADRARPGERGKAMGTFYTAWELGIGGGSIFAGLLLPYAGFGGVFGLAGVVALAGGALATRGAAEPLVARR